MSKLLLATVWALLLATQVVAQNNYSYTNYRLLQQSYADIAATGNPIAMTVGLPGATSSAVPVEIGFNFQFNGSEYTQFNIHSDGVLRLGGGTVPLTSVISASPATTYASVFTNPALAYQNLIMPLFMDLVGNGTTPQFHVLRSGTAPNRVCTVQWKNLRDADNATGSQHQFDNLSFQVKMYEGSNDIELVYGPWTPSAANIAAQLRYAAAGIKATSSSFHAIFRSNRTTRFSDMDVLDILAHNRLGTNAQPVNKNTPPTAGFTVRFYGKRTTDVSVAKVHADSVVAAGRTSFGQISALIRNEGTSVASNIQVNLKVTGANTHTHTLTIPAIAAGSQQLVGFPAFDMTAQGVQMLEVTAAVDGDLQPANDVKTTWQKVSKSEIQTVGYSHKAGFGIGFTGTTGTVAIKIFGDGKRKINQVRIPFGSYRRSAQVRIFEDGGPGGTPSATPLFSNTAFFTSNENELIVPIQPAVEVDGDFFVAVMQTSTQNMIWEIAIDHPINPSRTYNNTVGTWGIPLEGTPWQVIAKVFEENAGPDIGIQSLVNPGCDYSTNTEVKMALRNFSSQPINFATTPTTITGSIQPPGNGSPVTFSINKNTGTLTPGASEDITVVTGYDFTKRGVHRFTAKTNLASDLEPANDSLVFNLNNGLTITKNYTADSICPFTPVSLSISTNYVVPNWTINGEETAASLVSFTPTSATTAYISAYDYRNCLLKDSLVLPIATTGLPPVPVIQYDDTILSHRNGFSKTLRVAELAGHTIEWDGTGNSQANGTEYLLQGHFHSTIPNTAFYVRNSDGCKTSSAPVLLSYIEGLQLNSNATEMVSDTAFYDFGGPNGLTGNNLSRTFRPATAGKKLTLSFYSLELSQFASISVYDGTTANIDTRLGIVGSQDNGSTRKDFVATNADGALTVVFAIGSSQSTGWLAGLITDGTLPVSWLSFNAAVTGTDARLQWLTANETDCHQYEIQRSQNGTDFTTIAKLNCNNTSSTNTYNYTDKEAGAGIFYYRIKQIDKNGDVDYSIVRQVSFDKTTISVYPNPANAQLMINGLAEPSTISLYDATGKKVFSSTASQKQTITTAHLPNGVYQLAIEGKGGRIIRKVTIAH